MKIAMLGLGKMGGNMSARLIRNGISVVGYDYDQTVVQDLVNKENLIPASSVADALSKLDGQKIVWMMLPAGDVTEKQIHDLIPLLNPGDIIVDGGNSNYKRTVKMGKLLEEHNLGFMDCGTSGGVWGLDNGYCLMVGASNEVASAVEPVLRALAVTQQNGWAHVGPEIAAKKYEELLSSVTSFDLVLLGFGEDGHIASLFPGHHWNNDKSVVPVDRAPKPPTKRVSLTPSRLSKTKKIFFLVTGQNKQIAFNQWLAKKDLPASKVCAEDEIKIFSFDLT